MTKRACAWCGRAFTVPGGPGRPRIYCKASCKQRDYEARRRAQELGLSEHELVVTREELETTRDRLYVLACTVEDVQRDLARGDTSETDALGRLLEAAAECAGTADPDEALGAAAPVAESHAGESSGESPTRDVASRAGERRRRTRVGASS